MIEGKGQWEESGGNSERKARKGLSEEMILEQSCTSTSCKVIHEEKEF